MKKKYSETFGLNNNKLDDVEIAQFIKMTQKQVNHLQQLQRKPNQNKPNLINKNYLPL